MLSGKFDGGGLSGGARVESGRTGRAVRGSTVRWIVLPVSLLALACSSEGNTGSPSTDGDGGVASSAAAGSTHVDSASGNDPNGPNGTETSDGTSPGTGGAQGSSQGASSGQTGAPGDDSTSDGLPGGSSSSSGSGAGPTNPNGPTSDGQSQGQTDGASTIGGGTTGDDTSLAPGESTDAPDTTGPVSPPGLVSFEPTGGGFEETQVVELAAIGGETIHYTLDGSVPTLDSPVYDEPITLDSTAMVRVVIEDSGVLTYFAQTYVHLEQDVVDFSSNLPIVVIERHRDTPIELYSDELRPSSVLVFEAGDDGRSHVLGPATLSHRAGARVRGAYSRGFPQVGYAIETWEAGADEDEDVTFLGMPPEADWVLSAPSEMDRALMRNMFVMDLSRSIGRYAPRTKFVEVFLVDDEARDSLALSDYLGVYTGMEKIKRGADRVDVTKLRETDVSGIALTGGYMFRIDHDENDFTAGGFEFGWVYPDADEMILAERAPQVDYMRGYLDEFFACLNEDDFTNPTTSKHYAQYIDVPAWIDHHLINMMTKNVDGLRLSSYFYKDRNALLVAGPVWDFDRSLGTPHDSRAALADEWSSSDGTDHMSWGFWGQLFEDPDFAAAYWSRWDELREGAFSEQALVDMVDDYESRLTEARARHFDRWTEMPPQGSPAEEVEIIRDWLDDRLTWVDGQRP